jgi:Fe2+ transport system protein FeoA
MTLATAPSGTALRVVAIRADHRDELAREGITVGADVERIVAAPFRGPIIVAVGRARVALDRSLARAVEVAPPAVGPEASA